MQRSQTSPKSAAKCFGAILSRIEPGLGEQASHELRGARLERQLRAIVRARRLGPLRVVARLSAVDRIGEDHMPESAGSFRKHKSPPKCRSVEVPRSLYVKILRLWVMNHDRVGALLGIEHEVFCELHANLLRLQELHDVSAIFQVWTRRVSKAVSATAIALMKQVL